MAEEREFREITELDVREVSLVSKAANREKFLLFKSADSIEGGELHMLDNAVEREKFTDALNAEIEKEDELMAEFEKLAEAAKVELDDHKRNALQGALRLMASAELPEEVVKATTALAGLGHAEPEKPKGKAKTAKSAAKEPTVPEKTEEPKPVEPPEEIMAIMKSLNPDDGKVLLDRYREDPTAVTLMLPMLKAQTQRLDKAEESLKAMAEADDNRACATLIKKHELGDGDKVKAFVKGLTPEERDAFVETLAPWKTKLDEATRIITAEKGRSGEALPSDAMTKIDKMADELVEKSDAPLTHDEAVAKVLEQHPELYKAYEEEHDPMRKLLANVNAAAQQAAEGGDD